MQVAAKAFFEALYLPWKHCSCCNAYRSSDRLKAPTSIQQLALHHIVSDGDDLEQFKLCPRCHRFKVSEERRSCPYHPSNHLQAEEISELEGLSYMEQFSIRRAHPFQTLVVRPQGQQGARGQVIHFPMVIQQALLNLLPARPDSVLQVNYEKPKGESPYLQLRVNKVLQALNKLKEINPRYANVQLEDESAVGSLFQSGGRQEEEERRS